MQDLTIQSGNPISDLAVQRIVEIFANAVKPSEAIRGAINGTGSFDGKETIQLYPGDAYKVQLSID